MFYGAGAGRSRRPSAVIADLIDVARLERASTAQRVPALGFHPGALAADLPQLPAPALPSRWALGLRWRPNVPVTRLLDAVLVALAEHQLTQERQAMDDQAAGPGHRRGRGRSPWRPPHRPLRHWRMCRGRQARRAVETPGSKITPACDQLAQFGQQLLDAPRHRARIRQQRRGKGSR
ncbi:hypothetical protein [Aquabacterium sp.]|uniref:hypothetical protein n=1 Tax=Aquabacterium sp. TaxID=1872578 RepID=UPI00378462D5